LFFRLRYGSNRETGNIADLLYDLHLALSAVASAIRRGQSSPRLVRHASLPKAGSFFTAALLYAFNSYRVPRVAQTRNYPTIKETD
jgi:hypothetical protein